MKKLILLFFVAPIFANAQDSLIKVHATKLEKMNLSLDKALRREYTDLATYHCKSFLKAFDLNVQMLKIRDIASGEELGGVYITVFGAGAAAGRDYTSYIDSDEIPAMIKFMELLARMQSVTESNYVEYVFNSKDLQLFGKDRLDKNGQIVWDYGIRFDKFSNEGPVAIPLKDLQDLKQKFADALPNLNIKTENTSATKVNTQ